MKKAEEAALKAYPKKEGKVYSTAFGTWEFDQNAAERKGFQKGYEQAEKDTLERVILWLKDNANKYIVDIGFGYGEHGRNVELVVGGMCWEDLKKAMEEE